MVDRPEEQSNQKKAGQETGWEEWMEQVSGGKEAPPLSEADGYIEEVEKAGEKAGPIPTDDSGQPLAQPVAQPTDDFKLPDDAVVLPMTQQQFEEGIHAPLIRAIRWLAEWCAYMIKKFGEKVFFRG